MILPLSVFFNISYYEILSNKKLSMIRNDSDGSDEKNYVEIIN